jgi:YkoY family integral membrane protein
MMGPLAGDIPLVAWYIAVLVFLEGLLSADNALVLALMVRHLARNDRRRVLQWGIWGAIGFRVVAVFLSAILLKFWLFKVIGGGYLLYLAISHFWSRRHSAAGATEPQPSRLRAWFRGFWGTVAAVTLTDIAFSIDSIVAAVGMADDFPERFGDRGKYFIVLTGGILGIITMRFVVRYFVLLLDRFPGLAEGAYFLVAWIGLKLTISGLSDAATHFLGEKNVHPFHIPEVVFWSVMVLIMILSFVIRPKHSIHETHEASEELDLLGSENGSDENGGAVGESNDAENSHQDRAAADPGTVGGHKPAGPSDASPK